MKFEKKTKINQPKPPSTNQTTQADRTMKQEP